MHVPSWVFLAFAALVIAFGLYRIRLATKKVDPEATKGNLMGGGFYRMNPRTHLVIGVLYLLLGGALIATALGFSPLGSMFGPKADEPPPAKPSHRAPPASIELEQKK